MTPSHTKSQILQLRNKQAWFLASIGHAQTWDIGLLDDVKLPNKINLRKALMGIKTSDGKTSLFLGVNKTKREEGHYITFPSSIEAEARDMITQFHSYLVFKHDAVILKCFTPDAAARATQAPWDNINKCAKTEENETLQKLMK